LPWSAIVALTAVFGSLGLGLLLVAFTLRSCANCDGIACEPCAGIGVTADVSAFARPEDHPDSVRLCGPECYFKRSGPAPSTEPYGVETERPELTDLHRVYSNAPTSTVFDEFRIQLVRDGVVVRESVPNSIEFSLPEPGPGQCCSCGRVELTVDETGRVTDIDVSR
jgi:hypothetical protein